MNIKWYKIYYQDSQTTQKLTSTSKLIFELEDNIKLETTNYRDALYYNAKAVADSLNGVQNVLLSGGVDSEMIIRINKDLGIKQNVYTFKFEDDINIRDLNSAIEICQSLSIKLNIVDFKLKNFFENDAESYYKKTFCSRVEALPRLKWHEMFDNTLIFGDGEPYLRRQLLGDYSKKSSWQMIFSEHEFIHYLYTLFIGRNTCCPWYQFTPEVHGNFLKIDYIQNLVDDKIPGKHSSFSSKAIINREIFQDISLKPKLVGYEGKDMPPGGIPKFMADFRDNVMLGVIDTDIYYDLEKWPGYFR